MNLKKNIPQNKSLDSIFQTAIEESTKVEQLEQLQLFYEIVDYFRPDKPKQIQRFSIRELIDHLIEFDEHRKFLYYYMSQILSKRKFSRMMSDVEILQESDFLYEVQKRLWNKVLPYQPEKDSMEYVLNQVFYKQTDYLWIQKIPYEEIYELTEILSISNMYEREKYYQGVVSEILFTAGLLSQRMSGRSMESNIVKMVPEYTHLENPFLGLEREFLLIEKLMRNGELKYLVHNDQHLKQLQILLGQCFEFINQAFNNKQKYGITLRVNQALLRLKQQLYRFELMLSFLIVNSEGDKMRNTIKLCLKLIEFNCMKNDVSSLIKESIGNVSFQITNYTAKTGEHYITESASEYMKMFKAALGGGFIVGFLCVLKILVSKLASSDFGNAFWYSMNYSMGFILIYLLGYTLATKQPAMTASTITKSIEEGYKNKNNAEDRYTAFAELFAKLTRSQFIAFIGNIIMAFPVALLIVWGIDMATNINIVDTKWVTLLKDVDPIESPAIFHASIAGVFLFLSGIISGNVSNKNLHNQIVYRIKEHPKLKLMFGKEKTNKIASFIEKKWPGIVSNFWFGVFMGSTYSVGHFLGLDLDIRHITFASGNIALGAYGANFDLTLSTWIWSFIGLTVIGFMNFIVSFLLSIYLAFKSRELSLWELIPMFRSVWNYFKTYPMKFFFPPKSKKIKVE
ncbi:recombinase [Capnocytophaga sp. ARDL2]|uniref:recombinase n=1 Tax=Capnocytophaga sp. ARDL2 TaxID=3238809 RepID=UPI003557BC3E